LVVEAQRRRDEILDRARIEAEGIQADAEQYAQRVIDRLGEYLERIQTALVDTKEMLRKDAEAQRQKMNGEKETT
jgi:cell division septum initiation protein DivIVA